MPVVCRSLAEPTRIFKKASALAQNNCHSVASRVYITTGSFPADREL